MVPNNNMEDFHNALLVGVTNLSDETVITKKSIETKPNKTSIKVNNTKSKNKPPKPMNIYILILPNY